MEYLFLDSSPVALSQFAMPYVEQASLNADLGLFVQDTWTVKRWTFNYGLRFTWF